MLFISAQPDTAYFIWQLEIQLRNLNSLGVFKDSIHVLVSYNDELGLNPAFQKLIEENSHLGTFFPYEDQRKKPKYTSSIRPNLLKQHFITYPKLSQQTFMFHDSDILFSRIPQIDNLEENEICYVSDTRAYLDINCIRRTSSEKLLDQMLSIVGLKKSKLIKENEQTGGAQYILKGITSDFWNKIEQDSESLYVAMEDYNKKLWENEYPTKKEYRSNKRGIQSWCSDMWAVLWNLWLESRKVEIHPEMEFSWPYNPIEDWHKLAIQHYSGNIEDKTKYFLKGEYINYMPWYDETLDLIPNTSCSYEIVQLIKNRKKEFDQQRGIYKDIVILIKVDEVDEYTQRISEIYKKYILRYLDISVKFLCQTSKFSNEIYDSPIESRIKVSASSYNHYLIVPLEEVYDIENILNIFKKSINQSFKNKNLFLADALFSEAFSKMLEIQLLIENKAKFNRMNSKNFTFWIDYTNFHAFFFKNTDLSDLHYSELEEAFLLR